MTERHTWLNPATLRGMLYIAMGVLILSAPDSSARLLGLLLGIATLFFGASTVWEDLRTPQRNWRKISVGLVMAIIGIVMILTLGEIAQWLGKIIGVVLAARGLKAIYVALAVKGEEDRRNYRLVFGFLLIVAGAVVYLLPDALRGALLFVTAATAIVAGAITVGFGLSSPDTETFDAVKLGGFARKWLRERDVGDDMRESVVNDLYFEEPGGTQKQVGFWVLLILSTTIATLGILADSTAVVIGAMLVAPLMTPILGISAGIVNGWTVRVGRAFATVVGGVTVSILTAWIVSAWVDHLVLDSANSQILSRINPTLTDMLIAVAAGAAGAYATVDKRVSSSITGVAIAVALVPPLGVVGILLQTGSFGDASGAFLLFLTNLVTIILAAALMFVITGFAIVARLRKNREKMKTVWAMVLLATLIILLPLAFASEGIVSSAARQGTVNDIASEWLGDSELLEIRRVEVKGNLVTLVLTGEGEIPSIAELDAALTESFNTEMTTVVQYFPSEVLTADS